MICLDDILEPAHIVLGLRASSFEEAVDALLRKLAGDQRVLDALELRRAVLAHPPTIVSDDAPFALCIPHARTPALSGMVMAAARLATDTPFSEGAKPVRYVFCVGVPQELAADYLRLAGLLMRVFTDAPVEEALHAAVKAEAFLEALVGLETKLT